MCSVTAAWALCWTLKSLICFNPRSSWEGLAPLSPLRDANRGSRKRSSLPGDAQLARADQVSACPQPSAVCPLHPRSPCPLCAIFTAHPAVSLLFW